MLIFRTLTTNAVDQGSVSDGDLHLLPPPAAAVPPLPGPLLLPGQLHLAGAHQQPADGVRESSIFPLRRARRQQPIRAQFSMGSTQWKGEYWWCWPEVTWGLITSQFGSVPWLEDTEEQEVKLARTGRQLDKAGHFIGEISEIQITIMWDTMINDLYAIKTTPKWTKPQWDLMWFLSGVRESSYHSVLLVTSDLWPLTSAVLSSVTRRGPGCGPEPGCRTSSRRPSTTRSGRPCSWSSATSPASPTSGSSPGPPATRTSSSSPRTSRSSAVAAAPLDSVSEGSVVWFVEIVMLLLMSVAAYKDSFELRVDNSRII